jgi:8-oxo-dGTP pyrophosphatase MutT (NUDIX family)
MPVPLPSNAKRVFQGLLTETWQWEQKLFDDSTRTFECIVRSDTVAVIPFLDPETILISSQEQPGRTPFMDVLGGRVEPDESHEQAVRREFLEEAGYTMNSLIPFRATDAGGLIRLSQTIFLGKDLEKSPDGSSLDNGERITLRPTPWKEAVQLCLNQKLRNPTAMLAILAMEFDPEARAFKDRFLKGA